MKLTIKDLKTRNTSAVEVADDATVAQLKKAIEAAQGVPPEGQKLISKSASATSICGS